MHRPIQRAILTLMLVSASVGATFAYVEHVTRAWEVSRITGAPYLQVLSAGARVRVAALDLWDKLQSSELTDTDCAEYDDAIEAAFAAGPK